MNMLKVKISNSLCENVIFFSVSSEFQTQCIFHDFFKHMGLLLCQGGDPVSVAIATAWHFEYFACKLDRLRVHIVQLVI